MRGGEKMLESLLEIFPDADIFTHVYNPKNISSAIKAHNIYTSYINKLPFAKKHYKMYLPLMPNALLDFDLQKYDLVISSEAGPAKGVISNPNAFHICYCHTPMRYVWDMYHQYQSEQNFFVRFAMKMFAPKLRVWDITSANMVDKFITNSNYVAARIKRYYRRDAQVVFGPVDIEKFKNIKRDVKDYYLFFGQVTKYKRVDIAIEACLKTNRKLIVAGGGAGKKLLAKYKNNSLIKFAGKITDRQALEYYSSAKALLFPGIEDLGLVPIEANACGCPVIAYKEGGVLDTILENKTGVFFEEQNSGSLIDALDTFEKNESKYSDRDIYREHVQQFSKEEFKKRIIGIVNNIPPLLEC
jgi:glycosyltransferase involved in cell wall biosynthesis